MADKRLCKGKNISSDKILAMTDLASPKIKLAAQRIMFYASKLPESCAEEANQILEDAYKILSINSSFEEYFRIISGDYKLEKQLVEISSLSEDLCAKLLPFVSELGSAFSYSVTREKLLAMVDKERFQNAVLYIVRNSVKYSAPGSKIFLKVTATKRYVKISVRDRGKGMSKEVLEHCCEPFFSRGCPDAMGFGLTLAKHFVKESGGRFAVKSEQGVGTTVEFWLPIYSENDKGVEVSSYFENKQEADIELIKTAFCAVEG